MEYGCNESGIRHESCDFVTSFLIPYGGFQGWKQVHTDFIDTNKTDFQVRKLFFDYILLQIKTYKFQLQLLGLNSNPSAHAASEA